ncbi:MAG: CvpA family protein, partial [Oscillospiraceae bacterium]|nr:CvpA family protein [Oscillospiraceae bacterium]
MKAAIDIILLIIIALCTWNGYKKGLVSGIAAILAIVVAIFGGSLLSSAYAHEVVPALEPFVDGYIDSQDNRSAVLESMGYANSDYSVEDVLATDSSLKYDYAYECMLNVGFYSRISEKLAVDAVELAEENEMDTTDAVV